MSKLGAFFVKNAIALCEKYKVDVNIASYESEVEAYKAMVDAGIDQDDIISYFENALSLTFVDVREKALCYSAIKKDKLADLVEHVRVFPFEDGNMLKVAISNLEQMEYTENIMEAQNYSYVFCFQFLIDEELAKVDLAKEEDRQNVLDFISSENIVINKLINIINNPKILKDYWKNHSGLKTMEKHIDELFEIYNE